MDRQIQWFIFIIYGTHLLQTLNGLNTGSHILFFLIMLFSFGIFAGSFVWGKSLPPHMNLG